MKNNGIILGNEKYVEAVNSDKEYILVGEIQMIKEQAAKVLILSSIEIGRRLTEAKKMIKHGEWETWLKERVQFSQRTANNHMKIYKEYGENGLIEKSQSVANLSYTQAVALLSLPVEERENFIEENDVNNMKIEELKATIKSLTSEKSSILKELTDIKKQHDKYVKTEEKNKKEIISLKEHISLMEKDIKKAEEDKNTEIKRQLEIAVTAEKKKLEKMEEDNVKLKNEMATLKEKQSEMIDKAKLDEKNKMEKELEKQKKEFKKTTDSLQKQIEKANKEVKTAMETIENEKLKNQEMANITICNTLIEDILLKYENVVLILKEYSAVNPKNAEEILRNLDKSISIIGNKVNIKIVA